MGRTRKPKHGRKSVRGLSEHVRIGQSVQAEREAANISREQLAEHLQIHVSVVGRIEQGQIALTADRAKLISRFLGVSLDRLIGDRTAAAVHSDTSANG